MKYQIAYVSDSGNSEKLALGIAEKFSANEIKIVNLKEDAMTDEAEVYFICFGMNKGAVPYKILECVEELENKTVIFFVTCGLEPRDKHRVEIGKKILPFLPNSCNFRGVFMCRGEFPEEVLTAAEEKFFDDCENEYARVVLEDAQMSCGHPNQTDIDNAYCVICENLGLK